MDARTRTADCTGDALSRDWKRSLGQLAVLLLLLFALQFETARSIFDIWWRSETFAHGLLIVPVTLWLVWRRRAIVLQCVPQRSRLGLIGLALGGAAWLVSDVAGVQVLRQLAFVGCIQMLVLAVLGWPVVRTLLFPLAFLILGVPMGESAMQPLMNFTADFTVGSLQLLGFPVYREGTFFELPSGHWSVVEACSGLRYLMASITVGSLFAYLSYQVYRKRALFILASVLVPILANGVRALTIVLIAHYSDMKLAVGVDHVIYGWVFFGAVMLAMFWFGARWQDPDPVAPAQAPGFVRPAASARWGHAALVAGVVVIWPLWASTLQSAPLPPVPAMRLPQVLPGGWVQESLTFTDWRPHFQNPDAQHTVAYRRGDQVVGVHLAWFGKQRQDAELINSQNYMIEQEHDVWDNVGETHRVSGSLELRQTLLRSRAMRLLIWDWFVVGDTSTASTVRAKLLFARDRLLRGRDAGYAVVLFAPYAQLTPEAEAALADVGERLAAQLPATLHAAQ